MKNDSTILIVDDKLSAREILKGLLTGENYHLAFASDGQEALAKAAELTPDVVLLDVMMPNMDGFEVCRRLRADPLLAQVPIIMITALDDLESRIMGIEAGADDFLIKPFSGVELLARLRTTTRLNRYRRLLAEQAKFEWVVEKASDGYLVVDDNDHILLANSCARAYLGLAEDERTSTSVTFLELAGRQYRCEPEHAWTTWPEQSPRLNDHHLPRYLVRPESPTANTFWLQVEAKELPPGPAGDRVIHLRDVTAQMDMWCDIWTFQSLVSHKLRIPLGGMVSGLELLLANYGITKSLDADMANLFELIFRSAQRLKRDVEDILRYVSTSTIMQSGDSFDLLSLKPLVIQISDDLNLKAVTVSEQMDLNGGYVSISDQVIELILREILGNSKKFHPQQTPTVEILVSASDNNNVSLQIIDDGLTLSPEQLARVWIPYYQGDKYFTGEMVGMGLGLSKVAMLVWSGGGACRMINRKTGPGVIVDIILPLHTREEETNA